MPEYFSKLNVLIGKPELISRFKLKRNELFDRAYMDEWHYMFPEMRACHTLYPTQILDDMKVLRQAHSRRRANPYVGRFVQP